MITTQCPQGRFKVIHDFDGYVIKYDPYVDKLINMEIATQIAESLFGVIAQRGSPQVPDVLEKVVTQVGNVLDRNQLVYQP